MAWNQGWWRHVLRGAARAFDIGAVSSRRRRTPRRARDDWDALCRDGELVRQDWARAMEQVRELEGMGEGDPGAGPRSRG